MTLHWWMHWFWVTAQIAVCLTNPIPTSIEHAVLPISEDPTPRPADTATPEILTRIQPNRIPKVIGISTSAAPVSLVASVTSESPPPGGRISLGPAAATTTDSDETARRSSTPNPVEPSSNKTLVEPSENKTLPRIPGKKEAKITWVQAFSKPPKQKFENKTTTVPAITTPRTTLAPEDLTVMPLQEEKANRNGLETNAIRKDYNRSGELLLGEETSEPRVVATAASILDAGMSDSTRLGRARGGNSFNSEFQRDQLLSREEQLSKSKQESVNHGANVAEIATITGSCLAVVVLLSTVGSLGFIMYRRKYLNPPQTLNSDKCSNPDSSGYIDESTIRDNSEEMYSLDNDSFLNSLEAMTIQNYWTDSVKHTKL